jgi:hypothetical protein
MIRNVRKRKSVGVSVRANIINKYKILCDEIDNAIKSGDKKRTFLLLERIERDMQRSFDIEIGALYPIRKDKNKLLVEVGRSIYQFKLPLNKNIDENFELLTMMNQRLCGNLTLLMISSSNEACFHKKLHEMSKLINTMQSLIILVL